jgi:hypothetical protein
MHSIDVKRAMQMVDLMLKYARIPPGGLDHYGLSAVIETSHADSFRPWNKSGKARQAQTAFEKCLTRLTKQLDRRIDNDVKGNLFPFALL